jgi:uncharacterized protein (DUF1800 family)
LLGVFLLSVAARGADLDTVSLILIDGDVRQDWPDQGVVAVHRTGTAGALAVNFTIGGTALAGTDYTGPAGISITIPDGDREAWLEFAPKSFAMSSPVKTIVVTLQPGSGYTASAGVSEQSATVTLANGNSLPGTKEAIRFLNQAAFGPDQDLKNVEEVMRLGFDPWITTQFAKPVGLQQPLIQRMDRAKKHGVGGDVKVLSWWKQAMSQSPKADPLRQRVGFALSEIFVISDHLDELWNEPVGMLNFYDTLLEGSFGNFRTLLFNVAMHPCMGIYLNHLGNEKGDPVAGTFADENFAREIMQLFSIGLFDLNLDGTPQLDANNQPIQSYDNRTIADMAKVMTGFGFGGKKADDFYWTKENFTVPMRMYDEFHDMTRKTLLNGVVLEAHPEFDPETQEDAGAAALADVNAAVDMLFNHPNCPPFICKQLIQKLVTSNPSPAYVARVASKFVNNGSGVRGDMQAVIRAVLLDDEARKPQFITTAESGKMKEPYLRTANLMHALHARAANGVYDLRYLDEIHFQQPLSAPSVFNFFKPGYSPAGPVNDAGLVGPEFQILNAVTATAVPNYYYWALRGGFNRWGSDKRRELVRPDLSNEMKLVEDVPALMRRLDLLLTGGTLPKEEHEVIREAVEAITTDMWEWKQERVHMAIYLISTSPEFGILK